MAIDLNFCPSPWWLRGRTENSNLLIICLGPMLRCFSKVTSLILSLTISCFWRPWFLNFKFFHSPILPHSAFSSMQLKFHGLLYTFNWIHPPCWWVPFKFRITSLEMAFCQSHYITLEHLISSSSRWLFHTFSFPSQLSILIDFQLIILLPITLKK